MNGAKKLLLKATAKLELPADVIAGVPRIEILGKNQCCVEPQRGLLEYSDYRICVSTDIGTIRMLGRNMRIKQMNSARIVVSGTLESVCLTESCNE